MNQVNSQELTELLLAAGSVPASAAHMIEYAIAGLGDDADGMAVELLEEAVRSLRRLEGKAMGFIFGNEEVVA